MKKFIIRPIKRILVIVPLLISVPIAILFFDFNLENSENKFENFILKITEALSNWGDL